MKFLYSYETWGKILRYVDPNRLDNFTFDYESYHFYSDGRLKKTEDGYHIGPNGYYDPSIKKEDRVSYRFNNLFFRSRHFEKLNEKEVNILYSGCSWTYGSGMYEDFMWTKFLTEKIKGNGKVVKDFNVALPGSSVFLAIKNVMSFIRQYGKPTYIFINMPPIARDMKYDKKNNFFYSVVMGSGYFESNHPKIYLEYIKSHNHEDSILKAVDQIKMLEDYCSEAGIKLIWTFWHQHDSGVYESIKFDNIFLPDFNFRPYVLDEDNNKEYYDNPNGLPLWELAQDRCHPGSAWNIKCADDFYSEIVRRGYE